MFLANKTYGGMVLLSVFSGIFGGGSSGKKSKPVQLPVEEIGGNKVLHFDSPSVNDEKYESFRKALGTAFENKEFSIEGKYLYMQFPQIEIYGSEVKVFQELAGFLAAKGLGLVIIAEKDSGLSMALDALMHMNNTDKMKILEENIPGLEKYTKFIIQP